MANIFDRLAAGPDALQQSDYDDWNEMVGSVPPETFTSAALRAVQQVPVDEYSRHVQPGVEGTDPLGTLQPNQRAGIAQMLVGALLGSGLNAGQIRQGANVPALDPQQMSPRDLAGLLQWTKQNHPESLSRVASEYQHRPDILHSILSNKALISLVLGLGAQALADRTSRPRPMPGAGAQRFM